MVKTFIVYGILLCVSMASSQAIGMGPAKRYIDYTGSYSGEFTNLIINNAGRDIHAHITFKGDIPQYVKDAPAEDLFIKKDGSAEFTFRVEIPGELPPGNQIIRVVILEVFDQEGGTIVSRTGVDSIIVFKVPTPGKYLSANFDIPTINPGDPLKVTIEGDHVGTVTIDELSGEIIIPTPTGKITHTTNRINNLPAHQHFALTNTISDLPLKAGEHQIQGYLYYDDKLLELKSTFRIGDLDAEIVSYTTNASVGQINRISAVVRSIWSAPMSASVTFSILEGNNVLAQTVSESQDLKPWEKQEFALFIDTTSLKEGNYTGEYLLSYSGKTKSIKVLFTLYSGVVVEKPEVQEKTGLLSTQSLLITVIALLVLLILVLLLRKPPQAIKK